MSDEPENLTLRCLRRLDEKMDRVIEKVSELTSRMGALERQGAQVQVALSELSVRMDTFDNRLARIERRFDLVDVRA